MKKGEYESYLAACPFYRRESSTKVCCCGWDGVEEVAVRFRTVERANAHKEEHCRSLAGHKKCPIYQMIEQKIVKD